MTILSLFDRSVATWPRDAAVRWWSPAFDRSISAARLSEEVSKLAAGLLAMGLARGERVVLISENRPEWAVIDYGTIAAGGVLVPVYPSLTVEQLRYVLHDAGASFAIASTRALAEKLLEAAQPLRAPDGPLRHILAMEPDALAPGVTSCSDLTAMGNERIAAGDASWRRVAESLREDDLATIIYTSGTTGSPKGVMLTHGNITANVRMLAETLDFTQADVALSFLPLCHVTQRIADYTFFDRGVSIVYVALEDLSRALPVIRPTIFPGVPRVFEKARDAILARAARKPAPLHALFRHALSVGRAMARLRLEGGAPGAWLRWKHALADRVVLSVIRDGLGGRVRYLVSGGAPLDPQVMEFFLSFGVPILEGYGLTETTVLTINRPGSPRAGTVGPPLPGVQVQVDASGEILAAGPTISAGYFNDAKRTAASFHDGWFHTGDLGRFNAQGSLVITGRKKELLVTSGGKKVAPVPIEQAIVGSGLVCQAVLVGDRRKYLSALLVPDRDRLLTACRRLGIDSAEATPWEALLQNNEVIALYRDMLSSVNRSLARFEQIKNFALLPRELTQEAGELTPTLKLRRAAIEEKYRPVIDALYEGKGTQESH